MKEETKKIYIMEIEKFFFLISEHWIILFVFWHLNRVLISFLTLEKCDLILTRQEAVLAYKLCNDGICKSWYGGGVQQGSYDHYLVWSLPRFIFVFDPGVLMFYYCLPPDARLVSLGRKRKVSFMFYTFHVTSIK